MAAFPRELRTYTFEMPSLLFLSFPLFHHFLPIFSISNLPGGGDFPASRPKGRRVQEPGRVGRAALSTVPHSMYQK